VGRTRSEDGLDADLAAAPATTDWSAEPDGDWDWDAEWAATQEGAAGDGSEDDAPQDGPDDESGEARSARRRPRPRRATTARPPLRRPPGRRAPLLLAAAVIGAVLTALLGGFGSTDASPVASGLDYGLGVSDASFSGGIDVAGARGEISQAEAQARLSEIAASRAAREPDFVVPTDGRLTTCFCQRWGTMHWGIDLAAPLGTPIYAAADGVVLRAGPASGYGNAIYIQDADGNVEIYGHMRYYNVAAGDVVSAGEQIAKVGSQGQSTGPHLHFEIHTGGMNGKPTDPEEWLTERGLSVS
jgi:murein DD-endopeptidase MepM/ murein hydrolase activator NlpD